MLDGAAPEDWSESGQSAVRLPLCVETIDSAAMLTAEALKEWLAGDGASGITVVDFAASAQFVQRRIPGAWFALRSELKAALQNLPQSRRYVLTSADGLLAQLVLKEFQALTSAQAYVLEGGTDAWVAAGLQTEGADSSAAAHFASPRSDRYRRPYEGTDNPVAAMQAYLDWEYGLVEQLGRDGTHGFFVI